MDDRVGEWVARKAMHAADPFAEGELAPPAAQGIGCAIAMVAGRAIASSERIQKANGRSYFPVQDCDGAAFTLSEKRWR